MPLYLLLLLEHLVQHDGQPRALGLLALQVRDVLLQLDQRRLLRPGKQVFQTFVGLVRDLNLLFEVVVYLLLRDDALVALIHLVLVLFDL